MCPSIRKCRECLEINPIWIILAQFHSKKAMISNPHALIFNIEGATDHSCLISHSGATYKIFTVTFLIFNRIIFRFHGFQPHHPPFISTMHILLFINCSLSTLLLKSTVPWSSLLTRSFLYWFHHRSYKKLPGTFHFLTKPGFFSCVVTAKPLEYNITTLCHISTSITKLGWSSIHSKSAL